MTLSSATQHEKPPEFGRKWEAKCINEGRECREKVAK